MYKSKCFTIIVLVIANYQGAVDLMTLWSFAVSFWCVFRKLSGKINLTLTSNKGGLFCVKNSVVLNAKNPNHLNRVKPNFSGFSHLQLPCPHVQFMWALNPH